ncbi:hypothetical protein Avbf_08417 [Armadillidium vulgare]|nr:hypothetical protein Avbf_08417 [Armadillidium vulgare]
MLERSFIINLITVANCNSNAELCDCIYHLLCKIGKINFKFQFFYLTFLVTSLIKQKLVAEDEVKNLRDKILNMEESKTSLLQENSFLRQDFDNILSRGRLTGRWDCTDFTFNLIRPPENLLRSDSVKYLSGNASPKNFEGSDSPKSLRGSLSSLLSTEEEVSVPKLKQEVQNLRKIQRETNLVLTQRDKHIADLQAQLTDLHHKFSAAQTQVENTTSTLFSLMDRGRQDSFEIFRRDDVIRQLLSPSRRLNNDVFSSNFKEEEAKGKIDNYVFCTSFYFHPITLSTTLKSLYQFDEPNIRNNRRLENLFMPPIKYIIFPYPESIAEDALNKLRAEYELSNNIDILAKSFG